MKNIGTRIIIFIIIIFLNYDFVIIFFSSCYHFILFVLLFVIGKDIGQIYRYSQSQLSTLSLKAPVSSFIDPQNYQPLNKQQLLSLPLEKKIKTIMFCIPKIPSIMMQESQIMTTYSLVRQQEKWCIALQPFEHLIIIHNLLLPHPQVY